MYVIKQDEKYIRVVGNRRITHSTNIDHATRFTNINSAAIQMSKLLVSKNSDISIVLVTD